MQAFQHDSSHVVVVDAANHGQRLQAFSGRAFREQLGRADASYSAHAGCKTAAQAAVQSGCLQINGKRAAGRQVVKVGDVITLLPFSTTGASSTSAPQRQGGDETGRARMALCIGDDDGGGADPSSAGLPEIPATPTAAAFADYYAAQQLYKSPADWARAQAAFRRPMPLTLRGCLSLPSHSRLLEQLSALGAVRLRRLPWAPAAWVVQLAPQLGAGSNGGGGGESGGGEGGEGGGEGGGGEGGGGEGGGGEGGGGEGGGSEGGGGKGGGDGWNSSAAAAETTQLQLLLGQSTGEIALQEAAAMIPSLLLRPSHKHLVCDLCAAPGGKTLQLLDFMEVSRRAAVTASSGGGGGSSSAEAEDASLTPQPPFCSGMLVSNDSGWQRQERTVRRAWTSSASSVALLATVSDAREFALQLTQDDPPAPRSASGRYAPPPPDGARPSPRSTVTPLLFDRVLCDVPCGGDGTLRKSPSKWHKWSVRTGLRSHPLQLAILRRGVALLKPGGLLVYSTCALDPMQNEAVVLAALRADPSLALVEPGSSALLPPDAIRGLRHAQGLRSWAVPAPDFESSRQMFTSWRDVPEALRGGSVTDGSAAGEAAGSTTGGGPDDQGGDGGGRESDAAPTLLESMFGIGAAEHHLERCIRILPSHGDECGGFFVAALTKCADANCADDAAAGDAGAAGDPARGPTPMPTPELTRALVPAQAEARAVLEDFFGISPSDASQLCLCSVAATAPFAESATPQGGTGSRGGATSGAGDARSELAEGSAASALLCLVPPVGRYIAPSPSTRVLAAGRPLLARVPPGGEFGWWPKQQPWRVCQEGAALMSQLATRRVLHLSSREAARSILTRRRAPLAELRRLAKDDELWGLHTCTIDATAAAAAAVDSIEFVAGAALLVLPRRDALGAETEPLAVAGVFEATNDLVLLAPDDVLQRYAQRV